MWMTLQRMQWCFVTADGRAATRPELAARCRVCGLLGGVRPAACPARTSRMGRPWAVSRRRRALRGVVVGGGALVVASSALARRLASSSA